MRHLSPFALLGVLALANGQGSPDWAVRGNRRRLLRANEKTGLQDPKRALQAQADHDRNPDPGFYPATMHRGHDGVYYCEYTNSGFCNTANFTWRFASTNGVSDIHQAWSACTRVVQDSLSISRLAAAEYAPAWGIFYCYFDCPDFVTYDSWVEDEWSYAEDVSGMTFNLAIAAGSVPQTAPYLGPCIAPPAPPPMAPPMSPSELPGCTCHVYHNSAYKEMSRMCMKPWGDVNVCYPTRIATPGNPGQWQGSGEAAVYYDNFCHDFETMCQPLPDP